MNERQFTRWLTQSLDQGAQSLDDGLLRALGEGRRRALRRERPAGGEVAAGRAWWGRPTLLGAGILAAGVAMLAVLPSLDPPGAERDATAYGGDLDILLLTDDLPPNAYLDKDFPAWPRVPGLCRS
ncbi:MAG: DUF3619 family protein [Thiobacillaceae bacterium]|nr:DUF3619 family protein [Thiobacillaceae bacterium]